jgi:hypothetical protein
MECVNVHVHTHDPWNILTIIDIGLLYENQINFGTTYPKLVPKIPIPIPDRLCSNEHTQKQGYTPCIWRWALPGPMYDHHRFSTTNVHLKHI